VTGAPYLVIADDDVRYTRQALAAVVHHLGSADVVRPQNYFVPLPWHARWDTARTLLNRAWSADHPGTLGVRRDALLATGGYAGVLLENLELIRTIKAAGGRERILPDLFVARRPPTARHFGIPYAGSVIRTAAHSEAELRRRHGGRLQGVPGRGVQTDQEQQRWVRCRHEPRTA